MKHGGGTKWGIFPINSLVEWGMVSIPINRLLMANDQQADILR